MVRKVNSGTKGIGFDSTTGCMQTWVLCRWCPAIVLFVSGCKWERGKRFCLTIPAKMCEVFLFLFFGVFYTVDIKQNVKKSGFCMPCETKFLAFYLHQHNKINLRNFCTHFCNVGTDKVNMYAIYQRKIINPAWVVAPSSFLFFFQTKDLLNCKSLSKTAHCIFHCRTSIIE